MESSSRFLGVFFAGLSLDDIILLIILMGSSIRVLRILALLAALLSLDPARVSLVNISPFYSPLRQAVKITTTALTLRSVAAMASAYSQRFVSTG